jgi:hypothetical protein
MKKYTVWVYDSGERRWHNNLNGELHREDGPAIEHPDGYKEWHMDGKLHREDGPAIEDPDGGKEWFINDKRHREDGPAVEHPAGDKEWYINGVELTEREFNKKTKQPKDIEEIIEKVKNLRDSDSHVCQYDVWQQNGEPHVETVPACSCEQYDQVIDALQKLI